MMNFLKYPKQAEPYGLTEFCLGLSLSPRYYDENMKVIKKKKKSIHITLT